jgi:hypothetical protein
MNFATPWVKMSTETQHVGFVGGSRVGWEAVAVALERGVARRGNGPSALDAGQRRAYNGDT